MELDGDQSRSLAGRGEERTATKGQPEDPETPTGSAMVLRVGLASLAWGEEGSEQVPTTWQMPSTGGAQLLLVIRG